MIKWGKRFPVLLALAAVLTLSALALSGVVTPTAAEKEQRAAEILTQRSVTASQPVSPIVAEKFALEADEAAKMAAEESARMDKGQDPVHIDKPRYEHPKGRNVGLSSIAGKAITYEPRAIYLLQDFEGAEFPPTGWDTVNTDPGYGFFLGTAQAGGTQCALATWHAAGYIQDEWLISPQVDPTGASGLFRLEFEMLKGYDYPHDFKVYISFDGTNYTEIWDSYDVTYPAFSWFGVTVDLSTYAGGAPFTLGFQYYGEDADLFGIDNIVVTDDAAAVGRCCIGDPLDPTCQDLTQADCDLAGGSWTAGLNCTDNPCPIAGPNDNCSDVTPESLPFVFNGNNEGATFDEYCQYFGDNANVWIAFTIPECSDVTISYCGTQAGWGNGWLNMVTDCACGTLISYDSYDFGCANGNPNVYFSRLDAGTYYYPVMLDPANGAIGDYSIEVTATPCPPAPENDDCASAAEIGDVVDFAFSTAAATMDGAGYSGGPNLWYAYTATCDGQATVSLCGSSYDTKLAAYDGVTCDPLGTLLASNDDYCSLQSEVKFPVIAGNQYLLEVGSYGSTGGDGLLNIECGVVTEQPGDNCANPIKVDIPVLPFEDLGQTTCDRGNSYEDPNDAICMGYYTSGEDIFYEITVLSAVTVNFHLNPQGTTYAGMGLFSSCPPATDNCVAFKTSSAGTEKSMTCVSLDPGVYYLMIDTWASPQCIPTFDLRIVDTTCSALENDFCADAKEIGEVVDFPFSTEAASFDGTGGCMTSPNIWYAYTPSSSGNAVISLCGSGYDTKLGVYEGTCEALVSLGCNDDACGVQSELVVPVTVGNTYLVEVGGYSSNTGTGLLNISVVAPCEFSCPAGATPEGEPCIVDDADDVTNGGCNSDPAAFTTLTCGQTVCGQWSTYLFGVDNYRDTDWYLLEIADWSEVTLTAEGGFPIVFGFIEQTVPGLPGCDNITGSISPYATADECTEASVVATLGPGTYYVFVGGQEFTGFDCASGPWEYAITATCTPAVPTYCDASGGCDEYISNVSFGDINNASSCDGYADYTSLSTTVEAGGSYPITVDNGNGYSSDDCGIWIDWNQDLVFDAAEKVVMDVETGVGPYTGNVIVPVDAAEGSTRMRIRISYSGTAADQSPCGATSYGEVEDYTVTLGAAAPEYLVYPEIFRAFMKFAIDPMSGTIYIGSTAVGGDVNNLVITGFEVGGCPVDVTNTEIIPGGWGVLTGDVMKMSFPLAQYITCVDGGAPLWDQVDSFFDITYELSGVPGQMSGQILVTGHRSGDINLDGEVNVGDLTFMVSYLFQGGDAPEVLEVGNVDGSAGQEPNVSDLTYMVGFLFQGGPAPFHVAQ